MRVLVTNDDGIDSPGLAVLARVALEAGHDVVVAAPARESSGASASSTAAATELSSSTRWVWMIAKISSSLLG